MKARKNTKLGKWQKDAKNGGNCEKCHKYKNYLTVDHIVPKHLLEQLGFIDECYDMEENFAKLCEACNKYKGARIDITDARAIKILKNLINKL